MNQVAQERITRLSFRRGMGESARYKCPTRSVPCADGSKGARPVRERESWTRFIWSPRIFGSRYRMAILDTSVRPAHARTLDGRYLDPTERTAKQDRAVPLAPPTEPTTHPTELATPTQGVPCPSQ